MRNNARNRSPAARALAKQARRNPSVVEQIVWAHLKNDETGFHFRREVSIGDYRVDFYCAEAKLAFEFDGEQHDPKADALRDQTLADFGVHVIRFKNVEFFQLDNKINDHIREMVGHCEVRTGRKAADKPTRRSRYRNPLP